MDSDKEKMMEDLVELLNGYMEKSVQLDNQYVVGYYRVKDDELLGYHQSSFCEITNEILRGKRYTADNPYAQIQTISDNLKYILECTESNPGFMSMGNVIRKKYFDGYTHEELYLQVVHLTDGTPTHPIKFTYKS